MLYSKLSVIPFVAIARNTQFRMKLATRISRPRRDAGANRVAVESLGIRSLVVRRWSDPDIRNGNASNIETRKRDLSSFDLARSLAEESKRNDIPLSPVVPVLSPSILILYLHRNPAPYRQRIHRVSREPDE